MNVLKLFPHKHKKKTLEKIEARKQDPAADTDNFCYFCMADDGQVETIIKSNGVAICNRCIKECHALLKKRFPASVNTHNNGWVTHKV